MSGFGELTQVALSQSPKRLELVPYTVGDLKTQPVEAGNPLSAAHDPGAEMGLDLKYALLPGLFVVTIVLQAFKRGFNGAAWYWWMNGVITAIFAIAVWATRRSTRTA